MQVLRLYMGVFAYFLHFIWDVRLVGLEFWKQLTAEHGIGKDGLLMDPALLSPAGCPAGIPSSIPDRKDIFFYQANRLYTRYYMQKLRFLHSIYTYFVFGCLH